MSHPNAIKTVLIAILTTITLCAFGQIAKRETINRYQQITSLSFDDLKSQQYAALAKELSIENFMAYYMEHGKEKVSKKYGTEQMDSLYSDLSLLLIKTLPASTRSYKNIQKRLT